MSGRKNKAMRKVAKEMTEELIPQLANNTNQVIMEMQATWPHEDKVQFCRWFLGLESEEALMQELMGGGPGLDELVDDPNQLEFDFGGGDDDEERDTCETEGNPGDTGGEDGRPKAGAGKATTH